jgi:hypothetical protein
MQQEVNNTSVEDDLLLCLHYVVTVKHKYQ